MQAAQPEPKVHETGARGVMHLLIPTTRDTTMKLYYSPGACSLSPHIVLREAGLAFEPVLASTKTHKLQDGTDYYTINPKGYVPLLELDDGQRLSEGPGHRAVHRRQGPRQEPRARQRHLRALPPAGVAQLPHQRSPQGLRRAVHAGRCRTTRRRSRAAASPIACKWIDTQLEGKQYLMGDNFSVADAYLFTLANWSRHVGIDTSGFANLTAFMARMAARPAVQEAMKAEGLLK